MLVLLKAHLKAQQFLKAFKKIQLEFFFIVISIKYRLLVQSSN